MDLTRYKFAKVRESFALRAESKRLLDLAEHAVEVVFVGNESKKAVVVDDRHVRFANETTSLSALAKQLLGCSHPIQGTMYFTYNGKILDDIRKERERN